MATVDTRQSLPAFGAVAQHSPAVSHRPPPCTPSISRNHAPHYPINDCTSSLDVRTPNQMVPDVAPVIHSGTTDSTSNMIAQISGSNSQVLTIHPQPDTSISTVPRASAPVQPCSGSNPKLVYLRDCILDLETEVDTDTTELWQSQIRDQLRVVLDQLRPNDYTQELMLAAPRRLLPGKPVLSKSLVISVWDRDTKTLFQRKCKRLTWLKDHLRKGGLQVIITADAVRLTSPGRVCDAIGVHTVRTVLIPRSPDLSTWCGQKLVNITFPSSPQLTCTIGGVILIDKTCFLLTSGHAFFQTKMDLLGGNLPTRPEAGQFGDSASDSADPSDDESCFPSSTSLCSEGSVSPLSPDQTDVPIPWLTPDLGASVVNRVHVPLLVPRLAESQDDRDGLERRECDWGIIELPSLQHARSNVYRDPYRDSHTSIVGVTPKAPRARGDVAVILSPDHVIKGFLSPNPGSLVSNGRVFEVQSVLLNSILVAGSSGAWVAQDGLLCGYIIGSRRISEVAFMVPINAILEDIVAATGASDVSVFCSERMETPSHLLPATEDMTQITGSSATPAVAASSSDYRGEGPPPKRRRIGDYGSPEDSVNTSTLQSKLSSPRTVTAGSMLLSTSQKSERIADSQGFFQAENNAEGDPPPSLPVSPCSGMQPVLWASSSRSSDRPALISRPVSPMEMPPPPNPDALRGTPAGQEALAPTQLDARSHPNYTGNNMPRFQSKPIFNRVRPKQQNRNVILPYQTLFERFYIHDGRGLKWIMDYMKIEYGIDLSVKDYKSQLAAWGLRHTLTRRDAAFILRLLNDARDQGLEQVVTVGGRPRRREDIVKYIQRNAKIMDEAQLLSCISDKDEPPSYIKLRALERISVETPASGPSSGTVDTIPDFSGTNIPYEGIYVNTDDCRSIDSGYGTGPPSEVNIWGNFALSMNAYETPPLSPSSDDAVLAPGDATKASPSPGAGVLKGKGLPPPLVNRDASSMRLVPPPNSAHGQSNTASHGDPALPSIQIPSWIEQTLSSSGQPGMQEDTVNQWFVDFTHAALSVTPAVVVEGDLDVGSGFPSYHLYHSPQLNDGSLSADFVQNSMLWLICDGQDGATFSLKSELYLNSAMIAYVSMLTDRDSPGEECLAALNVLAPLFDCYGQHERLRDLLTRCDELTQNHYGADNPLTKTIRFRKTMLGVSCCPPHDVTMLEQVVADMRVIFLNPKPSLAARYNLAWAMLENELKQSVKVPSRFEAARQELQDLLQQCEQHFGADRIETIMAAATLARATFYAGNADEGERIFAETVLPRIRRNFPESHPYVWEAKHRHAFFLFLLAQNESGTKRLNHLLLAQQLQREIVINRQRVLGETNPKSMHSFQLLKDILKAQGKYREAGSLWEWCGRQLRVSRPDEPESSKNTPAHGFDAADHPIPPAASETI